jgi:acetolactate synthase-1/2/3 large subunit
VQSADRLPEYVARAFHTAMQGRPGPVVLALPEDMLTTPTAAPVLPRVEPALAWPAPGALRDLRALLLQAQRPIVIAGGSGWTAASVEALQRFAENWQLPVSCGLRFQDTFDNRHPVYAGDAGIGINPALARRIREADLVLAIGVRLGEMTTSGYTLLQVPRPAQKLVHLHAGPEELGRVYAADLMLQSSLACAGKALETLAAPPALPWAEWTAQARAEYLANQQATPVTPMDLAAMMKTVQRLAPADTVYTNGAGNFSGWLHRFVQYPGLQHHGRTQLACTSGAMGYGFPAAVAAALLYPQRTVDNGTYGTIRMHQEREYPGRVSGSDLHNPDFVMLARAYGWQAERVDSTAQFEPAFARALASGEPTLLHLKLDTDVITSRTTLGAIRAAAQARQAGA